MKADKPKIGSLPVNRIPYPDACIQTACGDPVAIKRDGVDLTEMPLECPQALTCRDAPDLGCGIVASGNNQVTVDL